MSAGDEHVDFEGQSLLVVDDDDIFRNQLARVLARRGLSVQKAAGFDEALESAGDTCPDMATVDLRMPGPDGLELVEALAEECPETDIVVLTGYGSIATAIDAVKLGAINYVQKPVDADDLLAAFERGRRGPRESAERSYDAPSLARAEWEHIHRVLQDCGGNISEAARRLGIHRRTLQRKLDTYPPES
ncbi:MAG: response regulator transcription factor [Myxococcota bacterium]